MSPSPAASPSSPRGSTGPLSAPGQAAERTATVVGSLQDVGCPGDWQPDCAATRLTRDGDSTAYRKVFDVPAGTASTSSRCPSTAHRTRTTARTGRRAPLVPLVLEGPAKLELSYDDETHRIGIAPVELSGPATEADKALAGDSLRAPLTKERFYFLMADRFANGDTGNDNGGLVGGRLETGFDPTDKGFYHGGDLKGVTQKLDYIKGLGTSAIWLTPSFKNRPVQGRVDNASAGYHGYWITDFTQIDPHLGSNEDMKALIDAAHAKGMKVFFDIITNHTADVISYAEGQYSYRDKGSYPYKDASGKTFDDRDYAGKNTFPPLDAKTSFPYTPVIKDTDRTAKTPSWLNDPTMYHNRGDSTFAGESSEYGDFVGLDDLFTERPEVVEGMGDIYKAWVDLGIDGFRIDTVKHVDMDFWKKFSPDVMNHAKAVGNDDFFMFGEVYDSRAELMSQYTTTGKLPATLTSASSPAPVDFAKGSATTKLRDFFAGDDWYTDADSNVYETRPSSATTTWAASR